MRNPRWALMLAATPVLAWTIHLLVPNVPAQSGAVAVGPVGPYRGAGSCSATACHGSVGRAQDGWNTTILRNEHTTWVAQDRHARAYQVLFDPRSVRIVRALAGGKEPDVPAHEDVRCLACHSTPRPAADFASTAWLNAEGVGCEACHGPSEKWLGAHTRGDWAPWDLLGKEQYGMTPTKDLARRAETCAGCHVGSRNDPAGFADRDVNHDLIAAGHPRLNFELAAYLANEPRHWVEKGPNATSDFAAREWVVGQVATTRAALQLLRERAADSIDGAAPWPEFTEYGCFSCHHGLRDETWRQNRREAWARPGLPLWGSWYVPLNQTLAADSALGNVEAARSLTQLVDAINQPAPPAEEVRSRAGAAVNAYSRWLDTIKNARVAPDQAQRLMASCRNWDKVASWDHAAQRYLALAALRESLLRQAPELVEPDSRDRLLELFDFLRYKPTEDGPREFDPGRLPANQP